MLQSKDINKIAELKNGFTPRWLEPDFILSSLTCFSFSAVCKHLNPFKQRGYSFESVFSCLISLPFLGLQSVHSFTNSVLSEHIQAKPLLGLGRCQSNDLDAQVADTTITMIQHILLTLKFRFEHHETKGALFSHIREGIIESRLNERLWGLFIELIRVLEVLFDDVDEMDLLQRILKDDKAYDMISRMLPQ